MEQVPLLRLGPIVLVSIQTELDDVTVEHLQEGILHAIDAKGAEGVLVDITALEVVDSFIARVLSDTARMASVMNTKVVLVGMRPVVTMTLLEMGLDFPGVETALNVETGLQRLGYALQPIDSRANLQPLELAQEELNGED